MKKLFILGLSLVILTAASAQSGPGGRVREDRATESFNNNSVAKNDGTRFHREEMRHRDDNRQRRHHGFTSRRERRRLHHIRRHERHERFHRHHYRHRRVM